MPTYVKRPIKVQAFRFSQGVRELSELWPEWLQAAAAKDYGVEGSFFTTYCLTGVHHYLKTLEGEMEVTLGDWIIQGIQGELYPCKPDIFEATYELTNSVE